MTKTMKKSVTFALFFLLSMVRLSAQSNTVAVGGEATGSGGTASVTAGQVFYTYKSGSTASVTEGVQQSYLTMPLSGNISGNAAVCAGTTAQLSIVLTGEGPWSGTLSDGTVFSGSANPLLVMVTPTETSTYTIATLSGATATASATDLSGSATVTVNPLLTASVSIASNADNNTICAGTTVIFTATPTNGGAIPSFQWKLNGANVGTDSTIYTNYSLLDGEIVTVVMTPDAAFCSTNSSATAIPIATSVTPTTPPTVTLESSSTSGTTYCAGSDITFHAIANNAENPTFQWKVNGNFVAGDNDYLYTYLSLVNGDNVSVEMTDTNTCSVSSVVSDNMTVEIKELVYADVMLMGSVATGDFICSATDASFTAYPLNGGDNPTFKWKLNGEIVGDNSAYYSNTSWTNGDQVTVEMTSNADCVRNSPATSSPITISVNPILFAEVSISSNADNNTICAGTSVIFTANPTNGGLSPSYQWKLNGIDVGTNSDTYTNPSLSNGDFVTVEMTSNATPCLVGSPALAIGITTTVNNCNQTRSAALSLQAGDETICNGDLAHLIITATGTGLFSGMINGTIPFESYVSPINVPVEPSETTTFSITEISDASGPIDASQISGQVQVIVNDCSQTIAAVLSLQAGDEIICNGDIAHLIIAVTGAGPWSGTLSDGTSFSGSNNPILVSVEPTETTTYTIATLSSETATASAADLSGSAIVTINVPTISASGSTTLCQGESVNLTVVAESNTVMLPLNEVGGATLAVGLRKLRSDYAGAALRLRRSSDNEEQDFGFTVNNLNTTAISTWLNGADGFCTTLYDQSGNNGNITQSDVSMQPLYVATGINNKPILHFTTAQYMFNQVNYPAPFSAIYGARMTGTSERLLGAQYNNWFLGYWMGSMDMAFFEGFLNNAEGGTVADNSFNIYAGTGNGNTSAVYKNGTQLYSDNGGVTGPNGIRLNGSGQFGELSDSDFTDIMVFGTELSSQDVVKLNTSISDYYTTNNASSNVVSYLWSNGATTPTIAATTAGDYTLTVTNSDGCSATSAATAVIVNYCEVPTGQISGDASLCAGNSTQLSIALTGQGPWSGTLSDGTGFSGGDNPILVTVTPTATTTYTIATLSSETATAGAADLSGSAAVMVNQPTTATTVATSCGMYIWETGNYSDYFESGTYSYTENCIEHILELTVNQPTIWFADTDLDTFGDMATSQSVCEQPSGYVANSTDCDPADGTKWQLATFHVDADGDGYTAGTASVCAGVGAPTGYSAISVGTDCNDYAYSLTNNCGGGSEVNLTMFVQGYYLGASTMNSVKLNQWDLSGTEPLATAVEDITVELHDSTSPFALIDIANGTLQTDGSLSVTFNTAAAGSYYIAVKGRNLVQTWSALPQSIGSVPLRYDFSSAASQAYGDNMLEVETGVFAMYQGELVVDDLVDQQDYTVWEGSFLNGDFGVQPSDLNGDGLVDQQDYTIWEGNFILGVFASYPF